MQAQGRAGQSPAQQESFLFNFRSIEVDVDFAVEGLVSKSEDGFIERRRVPYPLVLVPRQNIWKLRRAVVGVLYVKIKNL
jgi:starvation-inducible outer membrane lipoprotein